MNGWLRTIEYANHKAYRRDVGLSYTKESGLNSVLIHMFSGIPAGCIICGDCVPGVSAALQPPATFWDRFAITMISRLKQLVPPWASRAPPSGDEHTRRDFSDRYRYPRWVPRNAGNDIWNGNICVAELVRDRRCVEYP